MKICWVTIQILLLWNIPFIKVHLTQKYFFSLKYIFVPIWNVLRIFAPFLTQMLTFYGLKHTQIALKKKTVDLTYTFAKEVSLL